MGKHAAPGKPDSKKIISPVTVGQHRKPDKRDAN